MADTVVPTREGEAGYTPEGLARIKGQIKENVAKLREFGDEESAQWVEKHGLASLNSDQYMIHNIRWRAGFDSAIFTLHSVRKLLPARPAPPPVTLRREDAPIAIAPVAGKGMGMLAVRALPAGVPVLVEAPSLVLPLMMPGGRDMRWGWAGPPTGKYDPGALDGDTNKALFERVDEPQKEALLALHNCKPPELCGVEEGIIRTNALGIELRVPKDMPAHPKHRAVFIDLSRANHSCTPNIGYTWDIDSFMMTVYTLRDVKEGEELTISYVDPYLPCAQRQARLKTMYLFDCTCNACTKDAEARAKSDKRRAAIANLEHAIDVPALMNRWNALVDARRWDAGAVDAEIVKPLKTAYNLFVKEGLRGPMEAMCADGLMKIYMDMCVVDKAILWARRAGPAWMVRCWSAEKVERPLYLEFVQFAKGVIDNAPKQQKRK